MKHFTTKSDLCDSTKPDPKRRLFKRGDVVKGQSGSIYIITKDQSASSGIVKALALNSGFPRNLTSNRLTLLPNAAIIEDYTA